MKTPAAVGTRHAYRLEPRARDWAAARQACASAGARLVTIETAEEQAFLARQNQLDAGTPEKSVSMYSSRGSKPSGTFER